MALTDTERAEVRKFLGYPDTNRQLWENSGIEHAFDALTTEGEAVVRQILADLLTIETTLKGSWSRQKVLKAEEVTLAGDGEIRALWMSGSRLVGQLSDHMGVSIRRNVFSSGSRSGAASRG